MFNYISINTCLLKAFVTLLALLFSMFSPAGVDSETDNNGVILAGHDAVANFTGREPVKGKASISAVHNSAIYRFSNKKNRNIFVKNLTKYAPACDEFCAYRITFGKKFEVVDGLLYVNKYPDVYKTWKKNMPKHLQKASSEWTQVNTQPLTSVKKSHLTRNKKRLGYSTRR